MTGERRTILGISATIVRETVTIAGEVVEDTYDLYAQDRDGNVWYLGEAVQTSRTARSSAWPARGRPVSRGVPRHRHEGRPQGRRLLPAGVLRGRGRGPGRGTRGRGGPRPHQEWNPLEPEVVEENAYERRGPGGEEKVRGGKGR